MYNTIELIEKIKLGAGGDSIAAVEACKTLVDENVFSLTSTVRKSFKNDPNDKGKKMTASKGGACKTCNKEIAIGDMIYFKSNFGASHATCIEVDEPVPF